MAHVLNYGSFLGRFGLLTAADEVRYTESNPNGTAGGDALIRKLVRRATPCGLECKGCPGTFL